jgi:hypothetical protein
VVSLNGTDVFLGLYRSVASKDEYDRVIAEWLSNGRQLPRKSLNYTAAEIAAKFRVHAQAYYAKPDASATTDREAFKLALSPPVPQNIADTTLPDLLNASSFRDHADKTCAS